MAHENYLTAIRNSIQNGAADLGTLARFVEQLPEPNPAISAPEPGKDYQAIAAGIMRTMADDTAAFVKRLDGKAASPRQMAARTDAAVLLDLIARHQTCISSDLKALLKLYRQPVEPEPPWPGAPYEDERVLLSAIVQWLEKQSKDLKKVLGSQKMKAGKQPAAKRFKSQQAALLDLERSFARMSQDLAYVKSQHPRHMMAFKQVERRPERPSER